MAKVGVQMTHVCGHSGYHVVEYPGKHPLKVYEPMMAQPCLACQGIPQDDPRECILAEVERVVGTPKTKKKPKKSHRMVSIRRSRR